LVVWDRDATFRLRKCFGASIMVGMYTCRCYPAASGVVAVVVGWCLWSADSVVDLV
jgi:hypothetical protein